MGAAIGVVTATIFTMQQSLFTQVLSCVFRCCPSDGHPLPGLVCITDALSVRPALVDHHPCRHHIRSAVSCCPRPSLDIHFHHETPSQRVLMSFISPRMTGYHTTIHPRFRGCGDFAAQSRTLGAAANRRQWAHAREGGNGHANVPHRCPSDALTRTAAQMSAKRRFPTTVDQKLAGPNVEQQATPRAFSKGLLNCIPKQTSGHQGQGRTHISTCHTP